MPFNKDTCQFEWNGVPAPTLNGTKWESYWGDLSELSRYILIKCCQCTTPLNGLFGTFECRVCQQGTKLANNKFYYTPGISTVVPRLASRARDVQQRAELEVYRYQNTLGIRIDSSNILDLYPYGFKSLMTYLGRFKPAFLSVLSRYGLLSYPVVNVDGVSWLPDSELLVFDLDSPNRLAKPNGFQYNITQTDIPASFNGSNNVGNCLLRNIDAAFATPEYASKTDPAFIRWFKNQVRDLAKKSPKDYKSLEEILKPFGVASAIMAPQKTYRRPQ